MYMAKLVERKEAPRFTLGNSVPSHLLSYHPDSSFRGAASFNLPRDRFCTPPGGFAQLQISNFISHDYNIYLDNALDVWCSLLGFLVAYKHHRSLVQPNPWP